MQKSVSFESMTLVQEMAIMRSRLVTTLKIGIGSTASLAIYFQSLIPTSFHLFDNRFSVPPISALKNSFIFQRESQTPTAILTKLDLIKNYGHLIDFFISFQKSQMNWTAQHVLLIMLHLYLKIKKKIDKNFDSFKISFCTFKNSLKLFSSVISALQILFNLW